MKKQKKEYTDISKSNSTAYENQYLIIYDLYELDKLNPLVPVFINRDENTAKRTAIRCFIYKKTGIDNLELVINRGKTYFQLEFLSEIKDRSTTIYRCHIISKKKATHIMKKYGLDISTVPMFIMDHFNNIIKEIATGVGYFYGNSIDRIQIISPGDDDDDGYDSEID